MAKRKKASTAKASESPNPKGKRKAAASPAKKKKKSPAKPKGKIILERSDMKRAVLSEKKNTYLRIMSTNVAGLRGLLRNEDKVVKFLKVVESERPNIIAVQEHKLQEQHVEDIGKTMKHILPGYSQYWTCSGPPAKKGYSGVAMFVRQSNADSLKGSTSKKKQRSMNDFFSAAGKKSKKSDETKKAKKQEGIESELPSLNSSVAIADAPPVLSVKYGLGDKNKKDSIATNEGRVISTELPQLYIVNAYVPNSGQTLQRLSYRLTKWDKAFGTYLKSLEKSKPVLLVGDLNVCHDVRDIHNFYPRPWFPNAPESREEEYVGLKQLEKSAGLTSKERDSFGELLSGNGFVDTFRHFHPDATGRFSYWSLRSGNHEWNRGLRLDYAIVSESMMSSKSKGPLVVDSFTMDDYPIYSDHGPIGCVLEL